MAPLVHSPLEERPRDAGIEALIRNSVADLDDLFPCIDGCQVVIEPAAGHHRAGRQSRVMIEVDVGGDRIVVRSQPVVDFRDERAHQAVRRAFETMRRRLEDHVRFHREDPAAHARHFR